MTCATSISSGWRDQACGRREQETPKKKQSKKEASACLGKEEEDGVSLASAYHRIGLTSTHSTVVNLRQSFFQVARRGTCSFESSRAQRRMDDRSANQLPT